MFPVSPQWIYTANDKWQSCAKVLRFPKDDSFTGSESYFIPFKETSFSFHGSLRALWSECLKKISRHNRLRSEFAL